MNIIVAVDISTSKSSSVLVMTAVLIELASVGVLIYGMALLIDGDFKRKPVSVSFSSDHDQLCFYVCLFTR
jgi:hypothetical protein